MSRIESWNLLSGIAKSIHNYIEYYITIEQDIPTLKPKLSIKKVNIDLLNDLAEALNGSLSDVQLRDTDEIDK